jgi:hypothetical protein
MGRARFTVPILTSALIFAGSKSGQFEVERLGSTSTVGLFANWHGELGNFLQAILSCCTPDGEEFGADHQRETLRACHHLPVQSLLKRS